MLPSHAKQAMRPTRKPFLVLLLVGMAVAVPALAQTTSSYPAACDASKVSKTDVDRAHTVFLSGKGFLDESNYDKAISYFKDAYSIDCSVHGILPIIATAYERKGDKAEAIHALEEYLQRVPTAPDHEVIEHRIRNLKDQLAQEKPTATATATAPTATATVVPTVPPPPTTTTPPPPTTSAPTSTGAPASGGHTATPWVVVGVGGALMITGGVLFGVGSGNINTATQQCPSHTNCASSVANTGNTGRVEEGVGIAVGAVGVGAVVGGLVWHFVEGGSSSPASGMTTPHVSPVVAPTFAGLAVGGSF